MSEPVNGHDRSAAPPPSETAIPALVISAVKHWGVSPEGSEAVIFVESVSGQTIRLVTQDLQVLTELVETVKAARLQSHRNKAEKGRGEIITTPIKNFGVGSVGGLKGVVIVLEPGTPEEQTFSIESIAAARLAGLVAGEAHKQLEADGKLNRAVKHRPGVGVPRRGLILPGQPGFKP